MKALLMIINLISYINSCIEFGNKFLFLHILKKNIFFEIEFIILKFNIIKLIEVI